MQCLSKLLEVLAKSFGKTFPKVAVLQCSTKGAIDSSFRRTLSTNPSISKNSGEMQCLSKFFQVLAKISVRLS